MQFYPKDWQADTRSLSVAARGAWIDILCHLWHQPKRGQWSGSMEALSRIAGVPFQDIEKIVHELELVADIGYENGNVTLVSRRIRKDENKREFARIRKQRERESGDVTHVSRENHGVEGRSHKAEDRINKRKESTSTAVGAERSNGIVPAPIPEVLKGLELYEADFKLCKKLPLVWDSLVKAYPGVDIPAFIKRMHAWEMANPQKRKKNRIRALNNWLSIEQDRGRRDTNGNHQRGFKGQQFAGSEPGKFRNVAE
jgi:uncharacterized protein YdaU (DUF1376 family)